MTDTYIPRTSASDRYEAARDALAAARRTAGALEALGDDEWEELTDIQESLPWNLRHLADVIEALITPPAVGESEEAIVDRLFGRLDNAILASAKPHPEIMAGIKVMLWNAVRAGIEAARPSQEDMLRALGLDYEDGTADDGEPAWYVLPQTIEKEDDRP